MCHRLLAETEARNWFATKQFSLGRIRWAVRIKMRARLKGGQLLKELAGKGERQGQSQPRKLKSGEATLSPPKLSDLGITKHESSNWQLLAEACSVRADRGAAGFWSAGQQGGDRKSDQSTHVSTLISLISLGISRNQSSKYQQLAANRSRYPCG